MLHRFSRNTAMPHNASAASQRGNCDMPFILPASATRHVMFHDLQLVPEWRDPLQVDFLHRAKLDLNDKWVAAFSHSRDAMCP